MPSLVDHCTPSLDALSHSLRHATDELVWGRVSLDGWNNALLPPLKCIIVLFELAKLLLGNLPHILLWVEIRRVVGPPREDFDFVLGEGSFGSRSMQHPFPIKKNLKVPTSWKSFLEKWSQL